MNVEDAAKFIAAHENNCAPHAVSEDDCEPIVTALFHRHLPRLHELGFVGFDARTGDIRLEETPELLESFVRFTRSIEMPDLQ